MQRRCTDASISNQRFELIILTALWRASSKTLCRSTVTKFVVNEAPAYSIATLKWASEAIERSKLFMRESWRPLDEVMTNKPLWSWCYMISDEVSSSQNLSTGFCLKAQPVKLKRMPVSTDDFPRNYEQIPMSWYQQLRWFVWRRFTWGIWSSPYYRSRWGRSWIWMITTFYSYGNLLLEHHDHFRSSRSLEFFKLTVSSGTNNSIRIAIQYSSISSCVALQYRYV